MEDEDHDNPDRKEARTKRTAVSLHDPHRKLKKYSPSACVAKDVRVDRYDGAGRGCGIEGGRADVASE